MLYLDRLHQLTILPRVEVYLRVGFEVSIIEYHMGAGQNQVRREENSSACLESVARTAAENDA